MIARKVFDEISFYRDIVDGTKDWAWGIGRAA